MIQPMIPWSSVPLAYVIVWQASVTGHEVVVQRAVKEGHDGATID